ncbi:hypothetical protein [Neobacillus sp. NPDC093127]|uniref:hypothetical protein n=1 Tax=Neobacillus sp. NPDC093127 TaxID=3364296 RepID=UPI0037FF4286
MNLPKSLTIGGVPYEIKVMEGMVKELPNGDYVTGEIRYWEQEILLSDQMKKEYASKVLLHESIHGILHEYGMDKYNKEDLVDRLTHALFDFITVNDLRFITELRNPSRIVVAMETKPVTEAVVNVLESSWLEQAQKKEERRPRQLPLGNDRNTFSLAETAKIKTDEQDTSFWETGIKLKEGIKCYRTRYDCPHCGNKGKRYLPFEEEIIACHSCESELKKRPAADSGFPDRDSFGNYFIAGK